MHVESALDTASERLVTVDEGASVTDAARLLCSRRTDLLVVCDTGQRMVGVITKTDIMCQIAAGQYSSTASEVMQRDVVSCHSTDTLNDIWSLMKDRSLKNVPVVDDACRPLGVLNVRDLLHLLLRETEYEELLLRDYVMGVGYQ